MLDLKFFYQWNKNVVPVAGQYIQGNILLVSDDNHIIVKKDKFVSTPINTNAFRISTFIEFKFKERMIELVLDTIISLEATFIQRSLSFHIHLYYIIRSNSQ